MISRRRQGTPGLSRTGWLGFFVLGFLLTCASAATAYWSIPVQFAETNHAIAQAGSLQPPTAPTATAHGDDEIVVGWSLPAGQVAEAGYRVTRTSGPGTVVVCTMIPVDPAPATLSCSDTGLTPGTTYEYSIVAVIGDNWQSDPVSASATTLGVTTEDLPVGSVGADYTASLVAVGGSGGYTWALDSGSPALPAWADLDTNTGEITGTPTAVGTTLGLVFRVTDSDGHTATSVALQLSVGQGSTTTSVSVSPETVTYGAESAAAFAVTVRTADDAIVTDGSVTVSVGGSLATCTVLLPASSCSIGDTALPAGGPYAVDATFVGNADLAGSSGDAPTGLTVDPDSATVTAFSVTGSATYGAETGLVFTASVSGTNAAIPSGRTVAVTSGPTTLCTISLTQGTPTARTGSCSPTSATLLAADSYTVTATFNAAGFDPNFVTTAFRTVPLVISPATATVAAFTVAPNPVAYGAQAGLVYTASVSVAPASLPAGSTVVVTAGSTPVCTITLTGVTSNSGTGTCSPPPGTLLPVGPNMVTATFSAPNFTTATSNATVTVTPFAGIEWTAVTTTGTFSCDYTNPAAVKCTASGVGNRGTFQAGVRLVDANRNPFVNTTGSAISVTQTTTGGGGDTTPLGPLTIANGQSASSGSYTLTMRRGNQPPTTITASITIAGMTYTVNCVVSR